MLEKDQARLSRFINNTLGLFKIILCLFLCLIVIVWAAQIAEMESVIPFYDSLNNFLSNLSYVFYTPTKDSEENSNALMYMALAIVFFVLMFDSITDITADILKIYDQKMENAEAEANAKVNENLQKQYKMHLKTAVRFIVTVRLTATPPLVDNPAFKDEKMEAAIKLKTEKMLKEVNSVIAVSVKTPSKPLDDMLVFNVKDAEQLNQMLFFIYSICNVEKYIQAGLGYNIAVTTYNALESGEEAVNDAQRLMSLRSNRKILTYQIVSECLNLVADNNFKAVHQGEYSGSEENIYELVKKN
ncbi:MAG: hypothetical protein NC390_06385 [Fusobacterium sp.]|nr:hypothetical protein [Fusobacterium sp.]